MRPWLGFLLATFLLAAGAAGAAVLTAQQAALLGAAQRGTNQGWITLTIAGEPRARGFQHGYALAADIAEDLAQVRDEWQRETAMPWQFAIDQAQRFMEPLVSAENVAEIDGIVEGMQAAGKSSTRAEMIAYNGFFDLAWYWWPRFRRADYRFDLDPHYHCSSFVATGSMTRDGKPVLAHNTHFGFGYAPGFNLLLDVRPAHGHRFTMQGRPGWISSGTDFFVTDAGLIGSETTIGDFAGFDETGAPEFDRARRAVQYANSLDEFVRLMQQGNNGGYANAWLLADIHSGEIMRFEQGLRHTAVTRTKDGFFTGSNIAFDPRLRAFETTSDEFDIRDSSVARRERFKQLMAQHRGKLDAALAGALLGDTHDMLTGADAPSRRTICARADLDDGRSGGLPFNPAGAFDAKVADATLAAQLGFRASWGPPCGPAFNAADFVHAHSQFDAMAGDLKDMAHHDWITFAPARE